MAKEKSEIIDKLEGGQSVPGMLNHTVSFLREVKRKMRCYSPPKPSFILDKTTGHPK